MLCYVLRDPLQNFWASEAILQLARLESRSDLQLCRPRLPAQLNSWSCGHRCVVAWPWASQSELCEVPASLFTDTDEAIKGVCQEKATQTPAKRTQAAKAHGNWGRLRWPTAAASTSQLRSLSSQQQQSRNTEGGPSRASARTLATKSPGGSQALGPLPLAAGEAICFPDRKACRILKQNLSPAAAQRQSYLSAIQKMSSHSSPSLRRRAVQVLDPHGQLKTG